MAGMSETDFLERKGRRPGEGGWGEFRPVCGRSAKPGVGDAKPGIAPGLLPIRIPVTRENRSALRVLRARELELWEATQGTVSGRVEVPREDRESLVILLVLGAVALALWLQATSAAVGFMEGWEGFRVWVDWTIRSALSAGG